MISSAISPKGAFLSVLRHRSGDARLFFGHKSLVTTVWGTIAALSSLERPDGGATTPVLDRYRADGKMRDAA